jgi:tRNA-2-methylthio-N6-dimethylallyladenosine synthase
LYFSLPTHDVSMRAIKRNDTQVPSSIWFPTRIQDAFEYETAVQRLFVRHIVTETEEMAKEALVLSTKLLRSEGSSKHSTMIDNVPMSKDPFGDTAKAISACSATRDHGGSIGWVDRPSQSWIVAANASSSCVISDTIVHDLYQLRPKAGDVHILFDSSYRRYHVVLVAEVWFNQSSILVHKQPILGHDVKKFDFLDSGQMERQELPRMIGSFSGTNQVLPRRKSLKGHGVVPEYPMDPSSYHIQTSGCQMNVADSERLEGILQQDLKLSVASSSDQADIVLFNTCSIRDHAEQKLYDAVGPYAAAKRKGKRIALIVTGCVAQQEGEALLKRIPEIDAVLGPQYVPYLQNVLETVSLGHQVVVTAPMLLQEPNDDFHSKPIRGHSIRGWVNIIHGCNEHCTYCVVPGTRGMEQSRTMEAILQECLFLASTGYKEVTLLGQNIDAYGRDMVPKRTFADLLEFLNANLPNPMRIRYVTSHPRYFSDRVIDAVATLDKVCECFHMPFQAGDDEVLKNMRRGYTYDSYMSIIRKIRSKAPDAAICADIIVGFPGETEEQFQKTLQLMEEVKFDNVNSFAYSPRPNTEAALWSNQISESIKADRLQRVQALAIQHGGERSQRYLRRTVEVLVEDVNPRDPSQVMGRTRQGRQVFFAGDLSTLQGEFVSVKITEARTWSLMGELEVV